MLTCVIVRSLRLCGKTQNSTTYYFVDRVLLRMLVKATDDATKQIYVFFPPDKKIGIEVLRKYDSWRIMCLRGSSDIFHTLSLLLVCIPAPSAAWRRIWTSNKCRVASLCCEVPCHPCAARFWRVNFATGTTWNNSRKRNCLSISRNIIWYPSIRYF